MLVYLRSRAALGIGPVHALRGRTVRDENAAAVAAHILRDLGVRRRSGAFPARVGIVVVIRRLPAASGRGSGGGA